MGHSTGRRVTALILGAGLLGVLSACGEDLSKANYPRTTVTPQAQTGQGQVPEGEITDPAVSLSALRGVDVCKLLVDNTAELGEAADPYESEWGRCTVDVQDAGGKTIALSLQLGDSVVTPDEATGGVGGLPLIEKKQDDTCFTTAVTSRQPGLGITVQASYEGGNPCGPGFPLLERILQTVRAEPPKHPQDPGSLRALDPCDVAPTEALTRALTGSPLRDPDRLYSCGFRSDADSDKSVSIDFRSSYPPEATEGRTPVDLGNGVQGVQRPSDNIASCAVEWVHGPPAEGDSEVVRVDFYDYGDEAKADQACATAVDVAKSLLSKLPHG